MFQTSNQDYADLKSFGLTFLNDHTKRQIWEPFYELAHGLPIMELGRLQWLIAGYDDVVSIMGSESAGLNVPFPVTRSPILNEFFLGLLPHEPSESHRKLRSLTQPLFSAASIAKLEPQFSTLISEYLFPQIFNADGYDVLEKLGSRVPVMTSCLLLDIPPTDWKMVSTWAQIIYKQIGRYDQSDLEVKQSEDAYHEFVDYLRRSKEQKSEYTGGGIGKTLMTLSRNGDITDTQFIAYFGMLLFTGLDTLTNAIGNSIWFLGNHPEVFWELRNKPENSDIAFDEIMRLWGPIRMCIRQLDSDVPHASGTLPKSATAFLLIHAANRDERKFQNADQFEWRRHPRSYLAFGVGPHGCLGIAVGRLIGTVLFRLLATNCSSLSTTPGKDNAVFIPSLPILGIESVMLFAKPV